MTNYAQTNIQLYNQLRDKGYSKQEINAVYQAYELAIQLLGCLFRTSGKTFIAHLVGTASILGSIHVPANIVVAGLLHAAYVRGDFGNIKGGLYDKNRDGVRSVKNRDRVRSVIGQKAEKHVRNHRKCHHNRLRAGWIYRRFVYGAGKPPTRQGITLSDG